MNIYMLNSLECKTALSFYHLQTAFENLSYDNAHYSTTVEVSMTTNLLGRSPH